MTIFLSYMPANVVYGFAEQINEEFMSSQEETSINEETDVLKEEMAGGVDDVSENNTSEFDMPVLEQNFESESEPVENTENEELIVNDDVINEIVTNKIVTNEILNIEEKNNNEAIDDENINNEIITNEIFIENNDIDNIIENAIINEIIEKEDISEDVDLKNEEINLIQESVTLEGNILWEDENNKYNIRPEKVIISLLKNNVVYDFVEVIPNEYGIWSYKFESLEKIDEFGQEILYSILEIQVENYEYSIDELGNILFKIKPQVELIEMNYSKIWKDNNNLYGTRPESVIINLFKNNELEPIKTVELRADENGNWNYKFDLLEKYNEYGIENIYKIVEEPITKYKTILNNQGESISVLEDVVSLNLLVSWNDEMNKEGLRPENITVHLLDGNEIIETMSLIPNEENIWNYTYENLDKYNSEGILKEYNVLVDNIEEYNTEIIKINENEIKIDNKLKFQVKLTIEELLKVGPYVAMAVKLANETGEEITEEEQAIFDEYKALIYEKGAELDIKVLANGIESLTDTELIIYERYQEIVLNNGELADAKLLDINVSGDKFNSKEILNVLRADGAYYRYIKANGSVVNNSLKYVASKDGAAPKKGDEVAYCVHFDNSFERDNLYNANAWNDNVNDPVYGKVFKKLYSELSYVISIGCRTYGSTNSAGYSTKDFIKNYDSSASAIWQEDYYATQTAIYMVLYDYTDNIDSVLKTINFTAAEQAKFNKNELLSKIKKIFCGHSTNITPNDSEGNSSYADAHQKAVIDASKALYNAAKAYRNNSNSSEPDGYDASISMTPANQTLKYSNGKYIATVTVTTIGDLVGNITFSGVSGMSWTKNGNTYVISIPASNIKNVNNITITASAKFNKVKTVTYVCADTNDQNIAFIQEQGNTATSQSVSVKAGKPATVNIEGKKSWIDDGNKLKTRPSSIVVNLLANGVKVDSQKVTDANDWKYSFKGHAKKDSNGKDIKYTIEEVKVTGYKTVVTGYNLTNTLVGKVEVSGNKTWIDNNNSYNTRPKEINVSLYRNVNGGNKILVQTKVVKPDNTGKWNYKFEALDKYDGNGALYTYSVNEAIVNNYKSVVSGYNLTNILVGKVDVVGTKIWKDNNNSYNTRPKEITVNLFKNNELTVFKSIKVVPDANGNWNYKFEGLDKYDSNGKLIEYSVKEIPVDKYVTKYDVLNKYNLINTLTDKTMIKGEKIWKDNNNSYNTRPESIVIELYEENRLLVDPNVSPIRSITVYPDRLNKWNYEFNDLDKYDENGVLINYVIKEVNVNGYKTDIESVEKVINTLTGETKIGTNKTWIDNNNSYNTRPDSIIIKLLANGKVIDTYEVKEDLDGNWEHEFTRLAKYDENGVLISYSIDEIDVDNYQKIIRENLLFNKLVGKTEVKVSKVWKDNNNTYNTRPEKITVNLFKNNEEIPIQSVDIIPDGLGNWSHIFKDLEKYDDEGVLIEYSITENSIENYKTTIEKINDYEYNLTNTLNGEIELNGLKLWKDNNNGYGTRPDSIIVKLLANGNVKETKEVTPDKDGNWKYLFEKLTKYDDEGVLINYTLEEEMLEKYKLKIEGNNLINSLYEKITITGNKIWVDKDNTYKTRPEKIIVELLANGVKVAEKEVRENEEGLWEFEFEDVDKYDENGVLLVYTLNEQPVMGYETHINSWTNTIYNIYHFEEDKKDNLDETPRTGRKNWLKVFITTAISSLLALFGIGVKKLLGEGK